MPSLQDALKKGLKGEADSSKAETKQGEFQTHKKSIPNQIPDVSAERRARAPYNFIPLNDAVIEGEAAPSFDQYDLKRNTGYIDLEIATRTKLYIRDTKSQTQWEETQKSKNRKILNPDFFSPSGELSIPGSSLRGMVRNLVEILSFGKLTQINDTTLYYRAFADVSEKLQDEYKDAIMELSETDTDNGRVKEFRCKPKIGAGYLTYSGGVYRIFRAEKLDGESQYYRVEESKLEAAGIYSQKVALKYFDQRRAREISKPNPAFQYFLRPVLFKKDTPAWQPHHKYRTDRNGRRQLQNKLLLWYGKVTDIKAFEENHTDDWHEGWLVCSGFGVNKHMQWVVCKKSPQSFEVSVDDYRNDVNREEKLDLLKKLEDYKEVPCFYSKDETAFGHTGMFRLRYAHSIAEFVPKSLSSALPDIAESIFGFVEEKSKSISAGRVYFEDAKIREQINPDSLKTETPKTLGNPKPTSFQHYLVQSSEGVLENYNSNPHATVIRGHKIYWHRQSVDWAKGKNEQFRENVDTKIKPLPEGKHFAGRIRFENLSDIELGALLFALDLPPDCCHKIGMCKPLGFGSIEVQPFLRLSQRRTRYSALESEWALQPQREEHEKVECFKEKFECYILQFCSNEPTPPQSLWDIYRLKQLRRMLDWRNVELENWNEHTRYFEIEHPVNKNEYKSRRILPLPEEVVRTSETP